MRNVKLGSVALFVAFATTCLAQPPAEVERALQQLAEKREQQQSIYDSAMQKANRVAIADLTKFGKAEVRRNNLANAISAWQAILEIDPKDDAARRELEKLKQALKGMPAKQLGVEKARIGLEFTGNGFIQTAIQYSGDVPVVVLEAVVVPKSSAKTQAIIADFQNGGLGLELAINDGIPKWAFSCRDGNGYKKVYSAMPVMLNEAAHICGVKNGNFMALFVDGQRQGDWLPVRQFKPSSFPFLVAADPDSNGQPERNFIGLIDAVRVLQSRTALPPDFQPRLPLAANRFCALLLELNEGNGNTAFDASSNRRNCAIRGAKWTTIK